MLSLKLITRALLVLIPCAALAFTAKSCPENTQTPDARGVFVTPKGADTARFVPWKGEASVQNQLALLREAGGGEVIFAPGDYMLETGFRIAKTNDLRIAGSRATRLYFAPEPTLRPTLLAEATRGGMTLQVANPQSIRAGRSYQVYKDDLKGDRILEFSVKSLEGQTVHLTRGVHFMGHVKEIPAGSIIIDEINAFRVIECENLVIEGLEIDGQNRGDVHGHTTYCGVYAVGVNRPRQLPTSSGLTVRGCHIHGMKGRGICVYSMKDVLIEGNHVHTIDSQAVEIDHFAQGVVRANTLGDAGVGVALNDAYDSLVEANTFEDCSMGVGFVMHFDDAPFNAGSMVKGNVFVGGRRGVNIQNGIKNNAVTDNVFGALKKANWVEQKGGNTDERNSAL